MVSQLNSPVLQAAIETLIDSAVVINASGEIVSVNEACLDTFDYALGDLIGVNISCLMPEPYKSQHDHYIDNYHRTGEAKIIKIGREVEGLRSDGTQFPMHLAVGEMKISGERHYLGVIRDLTDTKASQVAFEELQAHHFHLSRVAAMNEMGTAIAHEINQPLAAAANYLETARILLGRLKAEDLPSTGPKIDEMMSKSVEQNKRASEIVVRMRRFIERGDSQPKNFDLTGIFKDTIALSITQPALSEIQIKIEIEEASKIVFADPIQVQQVLVNLIRNAVEAMSECLEKQLTITVRIDGEAPKFANIQIADTGTGIDPAMHSELFAAFISSKKSGLGVGLSISRSIISAMGGRIWALDNPEGGTIFNFTLPLGSA